MEGFVIGRQAEEFQDGGVAEGSDRVCVEAEGGGLEQNDLGDTAGLNMHVANGQVAVLAAARAKTTVTMTTTGASRTGSGLDR
jgi:hypothetical protein